MAATLLEINLLSFLKGRANGIRTAGGTAGSYRDLGCGTIGLAIVIHAILHVATDAFNVLLGFTCTASALFASTIHFFTTSFVRIVLVFTGRQQNIRFKTIRRSHGTFCNG